jgi:lipopolysaccharide/colanic/teichoic acid biosynthesis glycosyltransferase
VITNDNVLFDPVPLAAPRFLDGVAAKRAMDLVGALLLLPLAAPLILAMIASVWLSGGRPLFAHLRVGRGGRTFRCWKIRSMEPDAEQRLESLLAADPTLAAEWARGFKLATDPRVTRIGAFLRRTRLDELPQLWNVLKGEMSLVGPRPITREELLRYGRVAPLYCAVRPGLTGLWQVEGGEGTSYAERVELDRRYILDRSLARDIGLALRTACVMLRLTGR